MFTGGLLKDFSRVGGGKLRLVHFLDDQVDRQEDHDGPEDHVGEGQRH